MKILISNDGPTAFLYIRLGLARAFSACGHEVMMWDINKKPVYDAFDEFNPDIFLGQTYNTGNALCNAIKERPHMKVIMKAGDWGKLSDNIPDSFGVLKANNEIKKRILDLYDETEKPDYLHIYYHPEFIEDTHGNWMKHIPVKPNMLAADIFDYTGGRPMDEFKSDITFIGGYWEYKARNIDSYLLSLCEDFKYNIKIFGNTHWPIPQYCGTLPNELVKHALASATICPQIHEPHSTTYGFDMSERTFKLLANKCFCISDYVAGLDYIFGDDLIMTNYPEDFHERIDHFLEHPEDREEYINKGHQIVMNEHTYFHRVSDIFYNLGLPTHGEKVLEKYAEIKEQLS